MADEPKIEAVDSEVPQKTRRSFVKTAAQMAVTAPAVAALLSATTTPASAQHLYAGPGDVLDGDPNHYGDIQLGDNINHGPYATGIDDSAP